MSRILRWTLLVAVVCSLCPSARSADWPMWRADAGRGAYTTQKLPANLQLHWVRELPPPRPAWPATQPKLQFDRSYEPVVMGSRLFVSSSADDAVRAFSTRDGKELWRFYTDGPIRFAPVAVNGRVYVASDDGHLYCLNAETGELHWKVNGGPSIRPIIGNGRLVSSWPARGGPVYADGVVYFAAGIWPSMGIFIHAVDAKTGRILWTNSRTGSLYVVHPHGAPSFGSIVPQGHLVVNGDALIVPGGRSTPAVLDRRTGKLRFFRFDKRAGDHRVMSRGDYYFVAGNRYALKDGASAGSASPAVLSDDLTLTSESGKIVARELAGKSSRRITKDRRGRVRILMTFSNKTRWTLKPTDGSPTNAFLQAGRHVVTADKNRIAMIALPPKDAGKNKSIEISAKADWSAEVDGEVTSLLAADDRLFAVTGDGKLYCYGPGKQEPQQHPRTLQAAPPLRGQSAEQIATIRRLCEIPDRPKETQPGQSQPAYAVWYGLDVPNEVAALVRVAHLNVIAIDHNAKTVEQFRRDMTARGLYGDRLSAHAGNVTQSSLPPYIASYVICTDTKAAGVDLSAKSLQRIFRVLRPYGGIACLKLTDRQHGMLEQAVKTAGLKNAEVSRKDGFTLLRRVGPLPGSAGWTHQYGDGGNSVVSRDTLVKAPLGVLWFGGPSNDKILPRHGHGPNPQVAGGRIVIEGPDILRAIDVYTGRLLWERELKGIGGYYNTTRHFAGAGEIGSNYVTMPDAVYVSYGPRLLVLDAATGDLQRELTLKPTAENPSPNWGVLAVDGDHLVAASSPVRVTGGSKNAAKLPKTYRSVIAAGAEWKYLAGSDPPGDWTNSTFDDTKWRTGKAGFGYGDGDDRTVLKTMRGKSARVYIRRSFDAKALKGVQQFALLVNYDDAFIAYLNGKEIVRAGVGSGAGAAAKKIGSHEAKAAELFPLKDFHKSLRPGKNVLAIEGHNVSLTSSDFSLHPVLIARGNGIAAKPQEKVPTGGEPFESARYSSASKRLIVFDRKTGRKLWERDATFNFRHNCIVAAKDAVFCIDGLSPEKIQQFKRRGIDASGKAKLLALDVRTGKVLWSTDKDVFGTFLNYSREHDVLLQAGSAYRDRAKDEVSRGMVAYRGKDGKILWKDLDVKYGGPCLLWRDKIITNGAGGFQMELLTGRKTGWTYSRMYGCNTAVGCQNLLTFRSGAAGFYDLLRDSGTGNIGGFRSSCTSNLIAGDGVLCAPDYTRTCTCAYQLQTSLALIHMPENEFWTFNRRENEWKTTGRIGLNLGAPGDRRSTDGTLWLDVPSIGGPSPDVAVKLEPENVQWFQRHSSLISGDDLRWVAASGGTGLRKLLVTLNSSAKSEQPVTVRLFFAEPESLTSGERRFDIGLQGKTVEQSFDVVKAAGKPNQLIVREFRGIKIAGTLELVLTPTSGSKHLPILCGVEIIREKSQAK